MTNFHLSYPRDGAPNVCTCAWLSDHDVEDAPPTTDNAFTSERWVLTITLDSLERQYERDGELAFPNDEASQIVGHVGRLWHMLPEELGECVRWTDTRVELTADVLDQFVDLLSWVMMMTIPRTVTLTRE